MYCEQTGSNFALQDLLLCDLQIIQEALVELKHNRYNDSEKFAFERKQIHSIYNAINSGIFNTGIFEISGDAVIFSHNPNFQSHVL